MTLNAKYQRVLTSLILGLPVIICTFPEIDWTYGAGIDPPLTWVFNTLFRNGLGADPVIIFPHGPLAFFNYPLAENVWLVMSITAILKIWLVFSLLCLLKDVRTYLRWAVAFIAAYVFSMIAGFTHLLLACVIIGFLNSFPDKNMTFRIITLLLSAVAFYVKAYSAIIAGILFISFEFYHLIKTKKIRDIIIDSLLLSAFIIIFWLLLFGTFNGFFSFVAGMVHLAQDNSSAVAYYPYNNWLVLSSFIILVILNFLIKRTKETDFFAILVALSLFAAWKHGMAREDVFHVRGFFVFVMICLSLLLIFRKKKIVFNLLISIAALYLFSLNIKNANNYSPYRYEYFRVGNFFSFLTEYSSLKQNADETITKQVAGNILSQRFKDEINGSTTDIYPWDYSVIPANGLNWQHRPVLQSYASYTSWLDRQNADHFNSDKAPGFIVWETEKITRDVNGGSFNSIDGRYLLNDEPQTIINILRNYDFADKDSKFLLLRKRQNRVEMVSTELPGGDYKWGQWIAVPEHEGDILRAKLKFRRTFPERLKSFFYKDEQFWFLLRLANGEIHKYRIVPANAEDGLWIDPYIFNKDKALIVKDISIVGSSSRILSDKISVSWEETDFKDNGNRALMVFNVDKKEDDTLIFSYINDFEGKDEKGWRPVKENSYSAGFSMLLDSIPAGRIRIVAEARAKAQQYSLNRSISLVISVENDKGNLIWQGTPIDLQLIDQNGWNHIYSQVSYQRQAPGCKLKVYFWNQDRHDLLIDDFRVMIFYQLRRSDG